TIFKDLENISGMIKKNTENVDKPNKPNKVYPMPSKASKPKGEGINKNNHIKRTKTENKKFIAV
ncbi:424_t:CDS:1, partial [Funneliformis geosporum]